MTDVYTTVASELSFFTPRATALSMATETRSAFDSYSPMTRLQHGLVGGLVAGVVFGLMIQFALDRMTAIGAMYTLGDPSLSVGWVAHILHSVLFGAFFAVLGGPRLVSFLDGYTAGAVGGVAYGAALWAVNIVVLWPLWLGAVSLTAAPSVPYLAPRPLVGHLVYGLLLGLAVTALGARAKVPQEG